MRIECIVFAFFVIADSKVWPSISLSGWYFGGRNQSSFVWVSVWFSCFVLMFVLGLGYKLSKNIIIYLTIYIEYFFPLKVVLMN